MQDMFTNKIFAYICAALVMLPVSALVGKYATVWIAGFRVRYTKALISTCVAYVIVMVVGLALQYVGSIDGSSSKGLRLLAGWGVLGCCHIYFLRSDAGDSLSPGKACLIAVCQAIGGVIALLLALLIAGGIRRLFV